MATSFFVRYPADSSTGLLSALQSFFPDAYVTSVRNDYTSTSVTTAAWTQLVASTGSAIKGFYIFDSSGQTMELAIGAAASESRIFLISPGGGDGFIPIAIPAGTRISIRAVSANATVGELDINFLG